MKGMAVVDYPGNRVFFLSSLPGRDGLRREPGPAGTPDLTPPRCRSATRGLSARVRRSSPVMRNNRHLLRRQQHPVYALNLLDGTTYDFDNGGGRTGEGLPVARPPQHEPVLLHEQQDPRHPGRRRGVLDAFLVAHHQQHARQHQESVDPAPEAGHRPPLRRRRQRPPGPDRRVDGHAKVSTLPLEDRASRSARPASTTLQAWCTSDRTTA